MQGKILWLALAVCTGFASSVSAQIGTLTFSGKITASGCTAHVNGGNSNATVTILGVDASWLPNVGSTVGLTPFTISVTGCNNTVTKVWSYFSGGNAVASTGRLSNTTGMGRATGVELQLTNATGTPFAVAGLPTTVTGANPNLAAGAASMDYGVRYYRSGTITAGTVVSTVQYDLQFN